MESINPKIETFELEGKTYCLRCNMNVLAEVQTAYDGDLVKALDNVRGIESTLVFLCAMMNDWADERAEQGDYSYAKYTPKQLGRILTLSQVGSVGETVFGLVLPAVAKPAAEEDSSKN